MPRMRIDRVKTISVENLREFIKATGGRWFGMKYKKYSYATYPPSMNLSIRNCRIGVSKGVKGLQPNRKQIDLENGNITLWDRKRDNFRSFKLVNIAGITYKNILYVVNASV